MLIPQEHPEGWWVSPGNLSARQTPLFKLTSAEIVLYQRQFWGFVGTCVGAHSTNIHAATPEYPPPLSQLKPAIGGERDTVEGVEARTMSLWEDSLDFLHMRTEA
jgi:hypothetical protein